MSSLARINANRINGSKSRGPVTPEGKRISAANSLHSTGPRTPEGKAIVSQNAVRHGLLARSVVLPTECDEGFEASLAAMREELQPRTYLENEFVEIMAAAHWRRKRAWHLEMAQHTHAILARQSAGDPAVDRENTQYPWMHTALAFADLCDSSSGFRTLHRYEVSFSRDFIRHLRLLGLKRNISKQSEPKTR